MLLSHLRGVLLTLHVQLIESRHRVAGLLEIPVAVRFIHVFALLISFGPNDLELEVSFRHRDDDVFVCVEEYSSEVGPFRSLFAIVADTCYSVGHVFQCDFSSLVKSNAEVSTTESISLSAQ